MRACGRVYGSAFYVLTNSMAKHRPNSAVTVCVRRPTVEHDLPSGGKRLAQRATGYVLTMVSGQVTYRCGEATGALPGRLIRGAREAGPMPARETEQTDL